MVEQFYLFYYTFPLAYIQKRTTLQNAHENTEDKPKQPTKQEKVTEKNMYIKTASEWQDGTGDQHLYRYIFHLVSAVVQSQSTSVHTIHSC